MRRALPLVLCDSLLVAGSWCAALLLRYDTEVPRYAWIGLVKVLPLAVGVTLVFHLLVGVYSGVMRFASVLEARQILLAQTSALVVLLPANLLLGHLVPGSVPVIAMVLSSGGAGALRFWSRMVRWHQLTEGEVERLLVLGAGDAGGSLIKAFNTQPGVRVVGVLDDDQRLWGLRIHGARVVGPLSEVAEVAEKTGATRAVLAITGAPSALVRSIANVCGDHEIGLRVVPAPSELLGRQVALQDVRDLDIVDLLGRPQVETDLGEIAVLLRGRRVLITGGGGSIGSELARQVSSFEPATLTLLDNDETHLFDAAATLPANVRLRLADIRSESELDSVFAEERPEIVFHAAALKHVPLLEEHPLQAATTNVLGTRKLLQVIERYPVERFVQISTDKAVRPSSVMGGTKLLCEHMVLAQTNGSACAVRFGNVLGSRGSVVPTFVKQIRTGGPVTITDGRMTRYFMSIPEAVRLVLHAAALSRHGEIFMLDMGEPVRIVDLARRMIQLSGQRPGVDVEIRVTSIRPGEKLAEQLHDPEEHREPTSHPSIYRLEPLRVSPTQLASVIETIRDAVEDRAPTRVRGALEHLQRCREAICVRADVTIPGQRHPDPTRPEAQPDLQIQIQPETQLEENPAWT